MSFHAPLLSQLENLKNKALCLTTLNNNFSASFDATNAEMMLSPSASELWEDHIERLRSLPLTISTSRVFPLRRVLRL